MPNRLQDFESQPEQPQQAPNQPAFMPVPPSIQQIASPAGLELIRQMHKHSEEQQRLGKICDHIRGILYGNQVN